MRRNNKNPEKLTSDLLKNMGVEEPSSDFTQRVMQAVLLEDKYSAKKNYLWLFISVPVILVSGWYIVQLFNLQNIIKYYLYSTGYLIRETITTILSSFEGIKMHPTYFISFVAILVLLTIEETVRRRDIRS